MRRPILLLRSSANCTTPFAPDKTLKNSSHRCKFRVIPLVGYYHGNAAETVDCDCCRTNGKSDTIGISAFIDFLNDKQRDPRLNEILYPLYNERRATQIIDEYEQDKENRARRTFAISPHSHKIQLLMHSAVCCRPLEQGRLHPLLDVRRQCTGVAGPFGHLHGHGSTSVPLLHQLVAQHVSVWKTVWWQVFGGNVPSNAAGRMQVI